MNSFHHGGFDLSFLDEGDGAPVLLLHGFASNKETNWVGPGWLKALTASGHRVIAIDHRGHGRSSSSHDSALYSQALMAGDALALMDHLSLARADVIGYSMGSRLALTLANLAPERVRSLVLGGVGLGLVQGMEGVEAIVTALEAPDVSQITDPVGRAYRLFADQTKSDRMALAACVRSMRVPIEEGLLRAIKAPTLIAVGTRDHNVGSPHALAHLIAGSRVLAIQDRDHMSAVGDRGHKEGVLAFLDEQL